MAGVGLEDGVPRAEGVHRRRGGDAPVGHSQVVGHPVCPDRWITPEPTASTQPGENTRRLPGRVARPVPVSGAAWETREHGRVYGPACEQLLAAGPGSRALGVFVGTTAQSRTPRP